MKQCSRNYIKICCSLFHKFSENLKRLVIIIFGLNKSTDLNLNIQFIFVLFHIASLNCGLFCGFWFIILAFASLISKLSPYFYGLSLSLVLCNSVFCCSLPNTTFDHFRRGHFTSPYSHFRKVSLTMFTSTLQITKSRREKRKQKVPPQVQRVSFFPWKKYSATETHTTVKKWLQNKIPNPIPAAATWRWIIRPPLGVC